MQRAINPSKFELMFRSYMTLVACASFLVGRTGYSQNDQQQESPWDGFYNCEFLGLAASLALEKSDGYITGVLNTSLGQIFILQGVYGGETSNVGLMWNQQSMEEFEYSIEALETGLELSVSRGESSPSVRFMFTDRRISSNNQVSPNIEQGISESSRADQNDQRLVGVWRRTESMSSAGVGATSGFSMATDFTMEIYPDGSVRLSRKSAGGTGSVTFGGTAGGSLQQGRWRTEGRFFFTLDEGQTDWVAVGEYVVDQQTMMLKTPTGNFIWYRVQ